MPYLYEKNLDSFDRRDQLEIMRDNGASVLLIRGHIYDLTTNELGRARAYVIMTSVSAGAEEPVGIRYLPVKGNPTEGQAPLWSASAGAFIPGDVGSGGGGTGDVTTAALNAAIAAHSVDTTSVHGITDTTVLASDAELASAIVTHEADTTSVHGIANTANLATAASVASAVATHEADTTAVHGLSSTAAAKGVAVHNGTSYPSRPTGFGSVEWIGPTTPGSAVDGDTWVPTA